MRKIVCTSVLLCSALFGVYSLGVESYSPISTDETNRLDYRGTTETTVKLKVVDESGDHLEATIQAFECKRAGWSHPRICPFLAESKMHTEGVYTLELPNIYGQAEIRIITKEQHAIPIVLPESIGATIDLGTIVIGEEDRQRPDFGYDYTYREFEGQVLDEENNPIEGLIVLDVGKNLDRIPFALDSKFEYTDANGKFAINLRDRDTGISIHSHVGWIRLKREAFNPHSWDADSFYYFDMESSHIPTVHLETIEKTEIVVRGKKEEEVSFSIFANFPYSDYKIPLSTLSRRFDNRDSSRTNGELSNWLRASTDGHISRLVRYPSGSKPLIVDFDDDRRTRVRVTSGGRVVSNATISIVEAGSGYRADVEQPHKRSVVIDKFVTDRNGRLVVKANPNSSYVALVASNRFSPKATVLRVGKTNNIELVQRNSEVTLRGIAPGETVRLKVSGTDTITHFQRTINQEELSLDLASGLYDVTIENSGTGTVRGATFEVSNQPLIVDLSQDKRPTLMINLPPLPEIPKSQKQYSSSKETTDTWNASVRRKMPWGGVSNAAAISYSPGRQTDLSEQLPGSQIPISGTAVLRLPGTGRWFVHLSSKYRSIDYWLFTEVEVDSNEVIELTVPPLTGKLIGAVEFDRGDGFFHHGIAGPRMMLLAHDAAMGQWNVAASVPDVLGYRNDIDTDGDEIRFRIENLPIGKYRIEHYLNENGGSCWGGSEATLLADKVTDEGNLSAEESGPLHIDVVDGNGKRSKGLRLYVKNRMYDAWRSFSQLPTTGVFAAFPLDEPPVLPVQGSPLTINGVQEGLLELMLEDSLGVRRYYLAKVSRDRKIRLVVP